MQAFILDLIEKIKKVEADPNSVRKLPDNTCYLDNDYILCGKRRYGRSRYPYECDGLVLWASDNGHITANESDLTVFRPSYTDEVPCMGFIMGIQQADGNYFPISATEANAQAFEPFTVNRYTVFAPAAAYYLAYTDDWAFVTRVFVGDDKKTHFTMQAINLSDKPMDIYLASYYEALLRYEETENFWTRKARTVRVLPNGNFVMRTNHMITNCLSVNVETSENAQKNYTTASSYDFTGSHGRTFSNALALKRGYFENCDRMSAYASLPVAANLTTYTLDAKETASLTSTFTLGYDYDTAVAQAEEKQRFSDLDEQVVLKEKRLVEALKPLSMTFDDWRYGDLDPQVLNRFLKNVQRQVEVCSFGKSYAGPRLGIRDVFQQLEGALLWAPNAVRERIVMVFNYIDPCGRAPRQITIPPSDKIMPNMDIRQFIDQGFWLIDTVYSYICHTGDYSILDEECGYCIIPDRPDLHLCRCDEICDERNSLLEHMFRIVNYLESNLDTEYNTNCLRVLFGDWNDALDGMGRSSDPDKLYGSGVTVMGTLQFYRNLERMNAILSHLGGYEDYIAHYQKLRQTIKEGFFQYAVQTNDKGEKRIVHGWGDKLSYFVGSFCDTDGEDRVSFASNAFYALSGMMKADASLKETALQTLKSLDSQYGLLTLKPAFSKASAGVGRIANTTPGTAENCCAYVHASLFSICALFAMGESEFAWEQLHKSMVITHEKPSLTTFAMPNSYLYNPELALDGESAGDWFTGSGAVLIKGLVKHGFGIMPDLDGLVVAMPMKMPCNKAKIEIVVKGCPITVSYENRGVGIREYTLNGVKQDTCIDDLSGTKYIRITNGQLKGKTAIEVTD